MTLSAHQPHYLPYIGLLAKLKHSDVFVLQDDLQYVKQEWQNRNRIRTADGWRWLTIPVTARSGIRISQVMPANRYWPSQHRRIVENHYRTAPLARLAGLWKAAEVHATSSLAAINEATLRELMRSFDIRTPVVLQSALVLTADEAVSKDARLIALCQRLGCNSYLSGQGAKAYLHQPTWRRAGIEVRFVEWQGLPYRQRFDGWVPGLSSVDALINVDEPGNYLAAGSSVSAPW